MKNAACPVSMRRVSLAAVEVDRAVQATKVTLPCDNGHLAARALRALPDPGRAARRG